MVLHNPWRLLTLRETRPAQTPLRFHSADMAGALAIGLTDSRNILACGLFLVASLTEHSTVRERWLPAKSARQNVIVMELADRQRRAASLVLALAIGASVRGVLDLA
jgi:hypothetical protein